MRLLNAKGHGFESRHPSSDYFEFLTIRIFSEYVRKLFQNFRAPAKKRRKSREVFPQKKILAGLDAARIFFLASFSPQTRCFYAVEERSSLIVPGIKAAASPAAAWSWRENGKKAARKSYVRHWRKSRENLCLCREKAAKIFYAAIK